MDSNTVVVGEILSDHNAIKLEFYNNRNSRKYSNNLRVNNTLLHDE
jgi:hypothetical protein